MTTSKKTLVLGASTNESRYSNMAVKRLLQHGHEVAAIGAKGGEIEGTAIQIGQPAFAALDTVTLYLNPTNQQAYYDYILGLHPKRIIFNPGTENPELEELATKNNIEVTEACTLVLLSTGQY